MRIIYNGQPLTDADLAALRHHWAQQAMTPRSLFWRAWCWVCHRFLYRKGV